MSAFFWKKTFCYSGVGRNPVPFFLVLLLLICGPAFSNVCPKVGLGDTREDFEKVYGTALGKAMFHDEKSQDFIDYFDSDVVASFYESQVYGLILNYKEKLLKIDEAEALIKAHLPTDAVKKTDWEWGGGSTGLVRRAGYFSQAIASGFSFAKRDNKQANVSIILSRNRENTDYTSINMKVIEPAPTPEQIAQAKDQIRKEHEAEKQRHEETQKALEAERKANPTPKHDETFAKMFDEVLAKDRKEHPPEK